MKTDGRTKTGSRKGAKLAKAEKLREGTRTFWFTFFHEAGHILNDSKKETFIDVEYADDERERQANRFAANLLIPTGYEGELRRLTQYGLIEAFAARLGIAPGIVVGRLQREGVIKYNQFNGLKQKLEWAEEN